MEMLFAYGTLSPEGPESAAAGGRTADAVRGRLYDLGPYPALVDPDDPSAGWVEGFVRPVSAEHLRDVLDDYEGVSEGLFRRVEAATRGGPRAWVYAYARPIPASATGPVGRWLGTRRVRLLETPIRPPGEPR
ncbi:AIG2-like family protein [Aquisphaera giovannonii]|uniref:AIG2-like family protein n=1 Tax=Aquisphaera giovannonii TaxID=406548 RepID=A0A5B9VZM7_9BACT|nr:gamma-glutamylcyclotransferase [Aquisphaera giovannonii]QEH33130.1 AIG2-like family protein [Aquisphaera giovannonii]